MLPVVEKGTESVRMEAFLVERNGRTFVDVFLSMPREKLDVERVVVSVKDASTGRVTDERDYDMGEWNYEWTHTPEEWPAVGCPLHATHPAGQAYDPNVHMDDPTFNQAEIVPAKFNAKSSEYKLELVFEDVVIPAAEEDRVLTVDVMDARGNASKITLEGVKILRRNPS